MCTSFVFYFSRQLLIYHYFTLWPTVISVGWDRVNFHRKLGGLTQTSQSNGIFDIMWLHARYLGREAGWERVVCYSGVS